MYGSIGATPGQQRPGDARHLVGERDSRDLERSPRHGLRQPGIFLRVLYVSFRLLPTCQPLDGAAEREQIDLRPLPMRECGAVDREP